MIKTQIQLHPAQHRRLQDIARRRRISMAEAVRQSVDAVLARADRDLAWERARAVVGRYMSRHTDIAARHDRHLADIWSR
jgi:predicted transcriptional regulator